MAKKPNTELEEKSVAKKSEIKPNFFELSYDDPFYILELSDQGESYYVFNTLEGAVKHLDGLDAFDTKSTKLLSFTRADEQFSLSQISWADIYRISKEIRKKGN